MTTPVRQQYLSIKKQYPDAILFFRLGDFYETFDEDAKITAKALDIVLTSRNVSKGQRVPLAGIPYHAAESYIARLIKAGYKVAICEQVGDPIKGLMPRQVQRVITPGTVVESPLLTAKENNYLAALVLDDERAGIAYVDITTGEFAATELQGHDINRLALNEITRLKPAEIIVPNAFSAKTMDSLNIPCSPYEEWRFESEHARQVLQTHFEVTTLAGFGLGGKALAIRAAGAIVQYVGDTQKSALNHITQLSVYTTDTFMTLDAATRRNLELTETIRGGKTEGALLGVLDKTITAMGGRLLRAWLHQPLLDVAALNERLDAVETFYHHTLGRGDLRSQLKAVADLERLTNRVRQGIAQPRDLLAIRHSLEVLPAIQKILEQMEKLSEERKEKGEGEKGREEKGEGRREKGEGREEKGEERKEKGEVREEITESSTLSSHLFPLSSHLSPLSSVPSSLSSHLSPLSSALSPLSSVPSTLSSALSPLSSVLSKLDCCTDLVRLITEAIGDEPPAVISKGGFIRPGFSAELDSIMNGSRDARQWVANLESTERKRTGIKTLKVGFNKVFGYYIEVTHAHKDQVPSEYIRKQTLVNAERFITPDLKEYESLILNAEERQLEVETRLFKELCAHIAGFGERLLTTARVLAYLDVVAALAEVALQNNYVRPVLSNDERLEISNGRHPVVETMPLFDADGLATSFVPNDVRMSSEELIHVITGPNMSGKSTYLRQVALVVLLAQIGSFVPASVAHIGLVDRIFTRIGAQDEIHAGQSTFMVEMVETAIILSQSSHRSLLILDEVGRGTSTYDGLAIARAVVEHIHNSPKIRAKTLFATHYHELTEIAQYLPHIRNYNVAVTEEGGKVIFLHKIIPGAADRSYGIHVAQIAGIPKAVIDRANEILETLEGSAGFNEKKALTRQVMAGVQQLSLFGPETHPLIKEIQAMDVDSISPLEALNKLYELKQRANK